MNDRQELLIGKRIIRLIELTMEEPDEIADSSSGATEYKKYIDEADSWLIVVVNEERALIVTIYWTSSYDV